MVSEQNINLLYITNQKDNAEKLSRYLKEKNIDAIITSCLSNTNIVEKIKNKKIDCVLSDHNPSEIDGLKILDKIKKLDPDLPFILYTDNGSEKLASKAINKNIDTYIIKKSVDDQLELLENKIKNTTYSDKEKPKISHIESVIRQVNRALIYSDTRKELEKNICNILANSKPYIFAWTGQYDPNTNKIKPRTIVGIEKHYLEKIEITADETPTGQGPTGKAVKTNKIQVMQNIPENPKYKPWREEALKRGYKSSIAIPLIHKKTYGVLNIYADRKHAFDEKEKNYYQR